MKASPFSPEIIQGGMGVFISGWRLAKIVSMLDQLGTVSGVVVERVVARLLQLGDPGGHIRRALSHFPFPWAAEKVINAFYVEGGIPKKTPFKAVPVFTVNPSDLLICLTVCASYAFVWLSKEGHDKPVSINYLEKVAMPHVYAITGAMLADVDYITMGAGIPLQIPGVINDIAEGRPASYRVKVIGKNIASHTMEFDPAKFFGGALPPIKKPGFIPIVASNMLADMLAMKLPEGSISKLVVELWTAGGHNAPPRKIIFGENGEPLPIYGPRDIVDFKKITALGFPWYVGGSYASPKKLRWAQSVGAAGIQVGSILALSDDSDMDPKIRQQARRLGFEGKLVIRTDMRISSTTFPFKVAVLKGTLSEKEIYDERCRICNQGALVTLYERPDGLIGYRCSAEPVEDYERKGGDPADAIGRGCLCNGLPSTAGIGDWYEPPIVTLGDDVSFLPFLMADAESSYSAADAIGYLLG
jgi:NAD(P)H-dependent flavin oxidoreductase YrpB (nitropropane dioxygenase family)